MGFLGRVAMSQILEEKRQSVHESVAGLGISFGTDVAMRTRVHKGRGQLGIPTATPSVDDDTALQG